jgi:hypothetical protein
MRAAAFEELCRRMENVAEQALEDPVAAAVALRQLAAKSKILRSRHNDDSVLKELLNGRMS